MLRYSPIEQAIEKKYLPNLMQLGLTHQEAKGAFAEFVTKARSSKAIAPNYGDLLFQQSLNDPKTRAWLDKLRQSGLPDEEIRQWHNTHMLERIVLVGIIERMRLAGFLEGLKEGKSPGESTRYLFKLFPRFGDPDEKEWRGETTGLNEEDRPLPFEFCNAISDYATCRQSMSEEFLSELQRSTSLNAVVRAAMLDGTFFSVVDSWRANNAKSEAESKQTTQKAGCFGILLVVSCSAAVVQYVV